MYPIPFSKFFGNKAQNLTVKYVIHCLIYLANWDTCCPGFMHTKVVSVCCCNLI